MSKLNTWVARISQAFQKVGDDVKALRNSDLDDFKNESSDPFVRESEVDSFDGVETSNTPDIELSGDGTGNDKLKAELTQAVKDDIQKGVTANSWGDHREVYYALDVGVGKERNVTVGQRGTFIDGAALDAKYVSAARFVDPQYIEVERSVDGDTWVDAEFTDVQKSRLFDDISYTGHRIENGEWLKITINGANSHVNRFGSVDYLILCMSNSGHEPYVKITNYWNGGNEDRFEDNVTALTSYSECFTLINTGRMFFSSATGNNSTYVHKLEIVIRADNFRPSPARDHLLFRGLSLISNQSSNPKYVYTWDYKKHVFFPETIHAKGGNSDDWNAKQDKLTAGANITISGNVISASGGGSYNAGTKAQLDTGTNTESRVWAAKTLADWLAGKGYITSYHDTTYSAGNGLTLTGTQFSLPITITGTGTYVQSVAQTANGIIVTLGTPPNTTYSAGTQALLEAGTNTSNRVWSAKVLSDWTLQVINELAIMPIVEVKNSNYTLVNADHMKTLVTSDNTITIQPSNNYGDSFQIAIKNDHPSLPTSISFRSRSGYTYRVNDEAAFSENRVYTLANGGTCTIIRKANENRFLADGDLDQNINS